jgi:ATP-binding cassette subfamily B protein
MKSIFETKSFKALKVVWYFFKPYKLKLAVVLLIMVVSGLLETINLAALYPVINYGLKQNAEGFILSFFNKLAPVFNQTNPFLASCLLLITISIIAVGFKAFNYFASYKLMVRINGRNQKEVFSEYINADYNFFVRNQQGKLIHTGTIASAQAANMVLTAIRTVNDLIILLFMFSLLFTLTWQGSFIIMVVGVFYFLLAKGILHKIIYKSGKLLVEADRDKNVILNEFITGIKTIKVFLEHKSWRKKYYNAVDRSMQNQFRQLMGRVFPESLMKLLFFLILAGFGIFIHYTSRGSILSLMPMFAIFALVASRIVPAMQTLGSELMNLASCLPNTKIVYDLFHEETRTILEGDETLSEFNNEISFRDIFFKYKNMDNYLLKGLNFNIKKRKITAIVGSSGNGKTTIINLLLRLYMGNKGKISIDGKDISKFTNESFLAKIGYVSQETFICNDTIKENILFGMKNCSDEAVFKAAKQANAHEFIINTANGYNAIVGDSGIKLSGGQRQRIAIARALLRKPEIMVLDEATSSLDNIAEKKVQDAINKISQHATVLMIAHRLSTIQNADKILVMSNGSIIEEGRHQELLDKKGEYFRLYNMQLDKKVDV